MKNMDDSTKILAVSYGNFSCRLEGFDDSVETMKAVVSYFHELAGHERFMDMEPQAPDMATLARLTEEQTGLPVTVEGEGNSVSLRVDNETAAEDDSLDDSYDEDASEVEETADTEQETLVDQHDTIVLNADGAAAEDDNEDLGTPDEDEDTAAAALDETDSVEIDDADSIEEEPAAVEDIPDPADESVAAKLQRIRAVVSRDNAADVPAKQDDMNDDAPASAPATGVNPLAQRLADLAKRNAERAAEEAGVTLDLDDEEEDDDITAEELAELDAEFADEDDEASPVPASEDATEDDVLQLAPEDLADDHASTEDAAEDENGPLVLKPAEEVVSRGGDYGDFNLKEEVAEAQREIDEINEEKEARSKHDDVLDNVDKNMTRIMSQTDERLNEPEGRRHRDAFAQLKAAVAATEAARQLGDAGGAERDKNEVFREDLGALDAEEADAPTDDMDDVADDAGNDTNVEMTAADDAATSETEASEGVQEVTEETPAAAPLKLVSSQIVEPQSTTMDAASARLRQIAAQKDAGNASKGGFSEFAEQQGATDLADLLEAAAAYIAFVEGEEDFSRPQVMKKVQAASADTFTREDGLRAFGRLLRQNKIVKLSNGRFQISDDTPYRPEDQAAQG